MNLNVAYTPGKCYKLTIDLLLNNLHTDNLVVVHGIVTQAHTDGNRIVHAWVEDDNYVYDVDYGVNKLIAIDKLLYYRMGNIQIAETARYTRQELYENIDKYEHAGPYKAELIHHAIHETGSVYIEHKKESA